MKDLIWFENRETGTDCVITHKRKGKFRAVYCGLDLKIEDNPYVYVCIPTGPDSGQEHLANAKIYVNGKKKSPEWSEKLLALTLIESIEE